MYARRTIFCIHTKAKDGGEKIYNAKNINTCSVEVFFFFTPISEAGKQVQKFSGLLYY